MNGDTNLDENIAKIKDDINELNIHNDSNDAKMETNNEAMPENRIISNQFKYIRSLTNELSQVTVQLNREKKKNEALSDIVKQLKLAVLYYKLNENDNDNNSTTDYETDFQDKIDKMENQLDSLRRKSRNSEVELLYKLKRKNIAIRKLLRYKEINPDKQKINELKLKLKDRETMIELQNIIIEWKNEQLNMIDKHIEKESNSDDSSSYNDSQIDSVDEYVTKMTRQVTELEMMQEMLPKNSSSLLKPLE